VVCPVVAAIAALVVVAKARSNIAASGGALTGENLCLIATVLAWVNIGLVVGVFVVSFVVVLALGPT